MLPLAPGRFSITIGSPSASPSGTPTERAIWSAAPPGGKLTTSRIGLFGQAWASATPEAARAMTASSAFRARMTTSLRADRPQWYRGSRDALETEAERDAQHVVRREVHVRIPGDPGEPGLEVVGDADPGRADPDGRVGLGVSRLVEEIHAPARLLGRARARDEMRDLLPGVEPIIADLEEAERRRLPREPRADAEKDRVVRIEVEVEVRLQVRPRPADQTVHAPAELGSDGAAEEALRGVLRPEHRASDWQAERVLVADPSLLELRGLVVVADPGRVRPEVAAQVDVIGPGLVGSVVDRRRELEGDRLRFRRHRAVLAIAGFVERARGRRREQASGEYGASERDLRVPSLQRESPFTLPRRDFDHTPQPPTAAVFCMRRRAAARIPPTHREDAFDDDESRRDDVARGRRREQPEPAGWDALRADRHRGNRGFHCARGSGQLPVHRALRTVRSARPRGGARRLAGRRSAERACPRGLPFRRQHPG